MATWLQRLRARLPFRTLTAGLRGHGGSVICDDPLILHLFDYAIWKHDAVLHSIFHQYRRRPVYLLIATSWHLEEAEDIAGIARRQADHLRTYPNHKIIYLANTEIQCRKMEAAGIRSIFVNHNALIDPAVFRPLPDAEKKYAAIYDAKIAPYKRHELASQLKSLALVSARVSASHSPAYIRRISELLPRAHWYNDPLSDKYRRLKADEVNCCLNECRVGLCLSAREGAMYASIQYLLAGLPVVSTASEGGRDVFFDPDHTCIVADTPEAVAEGVERMCRCPVAPEDIRSRTREKTAAHLERLFQLLDEIVQTEGRNIDLRLSLDQWGGGKMSYPITPALLLRKIRRCGRWWAQRDQAEST